MAHTDPSAAITSMEQYFSTYFPRTTALLALSNEEPFQLGVELARNAVRNAAARAVLSQNGSTTTSSA